MRLSYYSIADFGGMNITSLLGPEENNLFPTSSAGIDALPLAWCMLLRECNVVASAATSLYIM